MITKTIDNVSFELKKDFDFNYLSEYGKVFKVFANQDSGYLCFGVQNKNKKLFLKMAGASTLRSNVSPDKAITTLKSTISIYEDLRHPNLIEIIEYRETKDGFLTVFEWFEGKCMGKQYDSFDKFIALPLEEKLSIYKEILIFHLHTNKCGYIALDFYDGSIMYDFAIKQTMICDVELYAKKPVINTIGRMWGSSRFMSPEEFQLGAQIDERSNVFLMAATAFQLLGGGLDRSLDKWQANEELHAVALKAVNLKKEDRYQTLDEYFEKWNSAVT
ncbi:serine/threonine protein kinase [Bacillus luteolus]|uniref:Serine/threonine protein kinase n=1 Tax=Litchfieldia luteola TaxID=682179 RepID=A0ABR9QN85_9BACI|nr:serine/threonine protein kinase [Cytobacillus luteolus]MBE4909958.1 serine/threonine protein kinase [Cytobacillus luteolus]MBP1942485.1 serine/threonine-protein kinase [Cytobacillus luteolus]